jgi:hypothetical protein
MDFNAEEQARVSIPIVGAERALDYVLWLWANRIQIDTLYKPNWWMSRGSHIRCCGSQLRAVDLLIVDTLHQDASRGSFPV